MIFLEELRPEISQNINLTLSKDWSNEKVNINFETSIFQSRFSNKIIPDFLSNDNQIIYKNLNGYAIAKGLTTEWLIKFKKMPLRISINSTLLDVANFEELNNGTFLKTDNY